MAEILITGLTLPKKGEKVTIELFSDGVWCDYKNNERHGKAIEVPEKFYYENGRVYKETD